MALRLLDGDESIIAAVSEGTLGALVQPQQPKETTPIIHLELEAAH